MSREAELLRIAVLREIERRGEKSQPYSVERATLASLYRWLLTADLLPPKRKTKRRTKR
jgi:hypothetical protein